MWQGHQQQYAHAHGQQQYNQQQQTPSYGQYNSQPPTQQGYGPFNALVWERLWGKDAGYVLPSVQVYRTSIGGDPAIAVQIGDMWRCAKVPNPGEYAHKIKNAWNPATLVKR